MIGSILFWGLWSAFSSIVVLHWVLSLPRIAFRETMLRVKEIRQSLVGDCLPRHPWLAMYLDNGVVSFPSSFTIVRCRRCGDEFIGLQHSDEHQAVCREKALP
jgi:hypothetical protein